MEKENPANVSKHDVFLTYRNSPPGQDLIFFFFAGTPRRLVLREEEEEEEEGARVGRACRLHSTRETLLTERGSNLWAREYVSLRGGRYRRKQVEGGSLSPAEFYGRFKGSLISARLSPDRPAGSPLLDDKTTLSPPSRNQRNDRRDRSSLRRNVSLDRGERFYYLSFFSSLFASTPTFSLRYLSCFSNHVRFSRVGRSRSRV